MASILAEWTSACNLRCKMCPLTNDDMRVEGHMSLELWEQILKCCRSEGHFVQWAHFFGEPLIWKNFFEGMKMWYDYKLSRLGALSTNGHLLTDERIECIRDTKIGLIRICIDSLRHDVYKRLRNNSNLDSLLVKVEKFLERAPDIRCQLQLMRSTINIDEDPKDYFKYFKHKNFSVFVSDCQDIGSGGELSVCKNTAPNPMLCNKVGYEHCSITWDGQISLCCVDYAVHNKIGDMSGGSVTDIYFGEYAEKMRSQIRQGNYELAPACSVCSMDHIGYTNKEYFQ